MSEDRTRKRPQRVQLACLPCRQGKLKCNRQAPCDQCIKRVRHEACIFTERGSKHNVARQKAEFMRAKVDRLENFVNQLRNTDHAVHGNTKTGTSTIHDTTAEPKDISNVVGTLRIAESGSTQFVGPSHWESIIEDIAEVKSYFDDEGSPSSQEDDSGGRPNGNVVPMDVPLGVPKTMTRADIIACLPIKDVMDRLLMTWFRFPDGLKLILHAPTFQKDYQQFWRDPSAFPTAWLALLCSVCALGAELTGQARQGTRHETMAADLRSLTAHALVLADYAKPQPYVIETLLLHIKGLLFYYHDVTPDTFLLLGLVTRLCTQGGYHRDPRHNPAISAKDGEMRRRVWAAVIAYDIKMCYQLGQASVVNFLSQDTAPMSNYAEEDLSQDPVPPPRPMSEQTSMTLHITFLNDMVMFGDVISMSHAIYLPAPECVEKLDQRLQQARKDLPPQLAMKSIEDSLLDPPELIVARYGTEVQYWKSRCVLYQRFLGLNGHEREQHECITSAEELVRTQMPLIRALPPGGQLESFMALMRSSLHHFNLAGMILCSHIKRLSTDGSTVEDVNEVTRLVRMLYEACGLWDACEPFSPKARHALRAINRFVQQRVDHPAQECTGNISTEVDTNGFRTSASQSNNGITEHELDNFTAFDSLEWLQSVDTTNDTAHYGMPPLNDPASIITMHDDLYEDILRDSYPD